MVQACRALGFGIHQRNFSRIDQYSRSSTGPRSFRVKVPDGRILRHIDHIHIRAPLSQKLTVFSEMKQLEID